MARDVNQRWRVKKFEKHCRDASVKQHDVVPSRKDRMHAEYLTGFRNVQKAGYPAELKAGLFQHFNSKSLATGNGK